MLDIRMPGTNGIEAAAKIRRTAGGVMLDVGRSAADVIGSADIDTLRALRVELPSYLAARRAKPEGLAGLGWAEADPAPVLRTIDRALVDRLPKGQSAALRIHLGLDQAEPSPRETVAGLRHQAYGSAGDGDGLRSTVAARLADQEAARGAAAPLNQSASREKRWRSIRHRPAQHFDCASTCICCAVRAILDPSEGGPPRNGRGDGHG
ncbi:hypothetical protein ACFXPV_01765 [Streptomyces sp. NPDC059118]|uniref:hypothetical protein n=1 Tax=unclassified Streptomyces TaxID=2593676 RepID=UPI00368DD879